MKRSKKQGSNFLSNSSLFRPEALFAFIFVFAAVGVVIFSLRAAVSVSSIKSGNWSDPTVWSTGQVPGAGDNVTITAGQTVNFDLTSSPVLGESYVFGNLSFDAGKSTLLQLNKNLLIKGNGKLSMHPASPTVVQTLRFVGVNDTNFVGGGMNPIASDVGLWAMDSSQLDIAGSAKTSWTNLTGTVNSGATSITTKDAPTGWQVGDEISIAPTEPPTVGAISHDGFDNRIITGISGNTVSFSGGLSRAHPMVNGQWTAEVMNLTRNTRIEGTAGGNSNSHVFIRSTKAQFISNLALRYMGVFAKPDQYSNNGVLGRYALHLHHSEDGSRGSIIDGVVVRNAESHSFVPHASHGVTMKNSISFDSKEDAFWWDNLQDDPTATSHDTMWDHDIVAKLGANSKGDRLTGFRLLAGTNNSVINSVGVGIGPRDAGAFFWDNDNEGVWKFTNNVGHNNAAHGLAVWQNSGQHHLIQNTSLYYNSGCGLIHGAYGNAYDYINNTIYGNGSCGMEVGANSASLALLRFENIDIDGAGITPTLIVSSHSAIPALDKPVLFRGLNLHGYTQQAVRMNGSADEKAWDFVNTTFSGPKSFSFDSGTNSKTVIRVQPLSGQATKLTPSGTTNIAAFAPSSWGTGLGLLGEYYNNNNFTDFAASQVDPIIDFNWNGTSPYWLNKPTRTDFSIRWTGWIEPQFDETYRLVLDSTGGSRIWVNDQLVAERWSENQFDSGITSSPLVFKKGQKYKIRLDSFFLRGNYDRLESDGVTHQSTGGSALYWESPSQPRVIVPATQLYAATSITTPPPSDTTTPTVSMTSPAIGATLSNNVNLSANASDNVGVSKVEFYSGFILLNTDTAAPYSFSWNTKTAPNGGTNLFAKAYDAAGNVGTSALVGVTISNDTTAPSTPGNFRTTSVTSSSVALAWNASTDNVGVNGYEVTRNGAPIGSLNASTTTFTDSTAQSNVTYTYQVIAKDAAGNQSAAATVQATTPPVSTSKSGDINKDGKVNVNDLSILLSNWNKAGTASTGDVNGDGVVNIFDLSVVLSNWTG